MTHAQPRMSTLLNVCLRAAETVDEKSAQPLFSARKIVFGIDRPEYVVAGNLPIKSPN